MSKKEDEKESAQSQSNGIAYRLPALPNLLNGADPKQRLPSFKSARRQDDVATTGKDQLQLPAKAETARKFAPKIAPKPKPNAAGKPKVPATSDDPKDDGARKREREKVAGDDKSKFRQRETIQTSGSVFDSSTQFEKKVRPTGASSEHGSRTSGTSNVSASDRGKRLRQRQEKASEDGKKPLPSSNSEDDVGSDDDIVPLTLPMMKSASLSTPVAQLCTYDVKADIKPAVVVRSPVVPVPNGSSMEPHLDVKPDLKPSLGMDLDLESAERTEDPADTRHLWHSLITPGANEEDFFTIQFPDYIPISEKMMRMKNLLAAEDRQKQQLKQQQEAETGGASSLEEPNLGAYKLCVKDIPEGMFCRLRLRRSGKTELLFPSGIAFPVILGCGVGFKQDVCVVDNGDNESDGGPRGKMTCLGSLRERLICVPDFEDLLKKSRKPLDSCSKLGT